MRPLQYNILNKTLNAKLLSFVLLSLLIFCQGSAQLPTSRSSSDIYIELQKLASSGTVLYIAAHPDDENTRLLAWLANEKKLRTAYLSLTRGDGGQNLIGDEQSEELGLIRTQELLAARRIDGAEQYFTRAFDFGFSKSSEETFRKWDKQKLLSDAVYLIRYLKPDLIIARFPEDSRAGHGQHSASAIIAKEAYFAAADPLRFPEQISEGLQVWQPKRLLWNTFRFGSTNTIDSSQASLEVGNYNAILGLGMGELAGAARSEHKSQGFGVSRQRGSQTEYFSKLAGEPYSKDIFEGIDLTWNRYPFGKNFTSAIDSLLANYQFLNPKASLPALLNLWQNLNGLNSSPEIDYKVNQVKDLIQYCSGIYAEATVSKQTLIPGDSTPVVINITNRSGANITLEKVTINQQSVLVQPELLGPASFNKTLKTVFTNEIMETQPYWLREARTGDSYHISNSAELCHADRNQLRAEFYFSIEGYPLQISKPIQFRQVDPVKGEIYNPVTITHPFLVSNSPDLILFKKGQDKAAVLEVGVTAMHGETGLKPQFLLVDEENGFEQMTPLPDTALREGESRKLMVTLPNYLKNTGKEVAKINLKFSPNGVDRSRYFDQSMRTIAFDHIPSQTYHYSNVFKLIQIDLKTAGKKIGYLPGAGDKVANMLVLMGYDVVILNEANLQYDYLKQFDAVITGIRAYNIHNFLEKAYPELMKYVQTGGNLIVQFNTSNFISSLKSSVAPYEVTINRTRVSEEDATVEILLPNHAALNYPNKISAKDFENWVQERSVYHADVADAKKWQQPLSMHDRGEAPHAGALAIAPFGKGNFVYTGLSFFRQLPAGVPGAFRLLANLIALPKRN